MKDLLMMGANLMVSLYIPFEIGRMLVEGVARCETGSRVGMGCSDSLVKMGSTSLLVRGGVFLALLRKDLCGVACLLFFTGMLTGSVVGYGGMALLLFIELMMLGCWIDWHRKNVAGRERVTERSMNIRRREGKLKAAIREGLAKTHRRDNKRMTAH